jgi:hypothetical protein
MPGNNFQLRYGKGKERFPLGKASTGNDVPMPKDASDSFKKRFIQYNKNAIKSTANLTVDLIGSYLPNIKSIGESISESQREVRRNIKTNFSKITKTVANITDGGDGTKGNPAKFVKDMAVSTFNDSIARLKAGQFYKSNKERAEESSKAMMGGFGIGDDDFSDFDFDDEAPSGSSGLTTSLSDEPFGVPLTTVEKRSLNGSSRPGSGRRRAPKTKVVTINNNNTSSSQLTLGDKLNSDTVQYAASALISEQENLFKKQFAADEVRHGTLIRYQDSILKGVNAITEHLQNVEGQGTASMLEIGQKMLSLQESNLELLKELKQTVIVASPAYDEEIKRDRSKLANILDGKNGLNSKEFFKNIKGNVMDIAYGSPVGGLLGVAPMLSMAFGMGDMGGLGGKPKFDLLGTLMRAGANSMMSRQTRGRLANLNEIASGIGPLLMGQMNKMARFSENPIFRTMGQIFGIKQSRAKRINFGVADLEAKVNWTAKSERTLNEVIPTYLSKITAALTGSEETFYDYNLGQLRKSSNIISERERVKEAAWYDSTIENGAERMATQGMKESKMSKVLIQKKISQEDIRKYIDIIMKNISKSATNYAPEYLEDESYAKQLSEGIPEKHSREALYLFNEMYDRLDPERRLLLNRRLIERGVKAENTLLDFNKNVIKSGGSGALQNAIADEEISKLENELKYSPHLQLEGVDKKSMLYGQRQRQIIETKKRIDALKSSSMGQVSAIRINDDMTAGMGG